MSLKEQIIVSLGKKIWGITPFDCEYMRDLLDNLTDDEARKVYKEVVNSERVTLNLFAKACRKVKGEAILSHEIEAKNLLERLHKIVDKINDERNINNFIYGKYPLSQIKIGSNPAFSEREIRVLRMAHKTYKELVQYRDYQRVLDNLRTISLKFWLAGLTNGYQAIKHQSA